MGYNRKAFIHSRPRPPLPELATRGELYQLHGQSLQLPPSCRFPPLREGNREARLLRVPPDFRGNLKEGVINGCFFVNFGSAIGIISIPDGRVLIPVADVCRFIGSVLRFIADVCVSIESVCVSIESVCVSIGVGEVVGVAKGNQVLPQSLSSL